jgi:hypothetical protein
MTTIDSLLPIISSNIKLIQHNIPKKDKRILLSLAKQLNSGIFLTENQANLLIKIIHENRNQVSSIVSNLDDTLALPSWTKVFREVKRIKKIYISSEFPESFVVEFSFNTRLKEKMMQLTIQLRGNVSISGQKYVIPLTEENLQLIVNGFFKDGFEIDEKIQIFHREIEEIKTTSTNPFNIYQLSNEKIKKAVIDAMGPNYLKNPLFLQDQKIRYQYQNTEKIPENSLVDKIANRPNRKIFIDSSSIDFNLLITSLISLDRFPLLVIFDGHHAAKDKKSLKLVQSAVSSLNLSNDIGIYFRYNKEADGERFNQDIADLAYNKVLSPTTHIAGISNNKIPKFMIKDGWKPKTVVSFTNSFKSNKSYIYCSDVDLIVYYNNTQPLDKDVYAIM